MTRDELIVILTPWVKKAVEKKVPFGGRWLATRDILWHVALAVDVAIGMWGARVVDLLEQHLPNPERIFSPEVSGYINHLRELCNTDVKQLDPIAEEARTGNVRGQISTGGDGAE